MKFWPSSSPLPLHGVVIFCFSICEPTAFQKGIMGIKKEAKGSRDRIRSGGFNSCVLQKHSLILTAGLDLTGFVQ